MKKMMTVYLVFIVGTWLAGIYGPWWAPAAFILLTSALMELSVRKALLSGAVVLGIVYLGMALYMLTKDASGIIEKTGALMGGLSPALLITVTTVIGVITGALSGWSGSTLRLMLKKHPTTEN